MLLLQPMSLPARLPRHPARKQWDGMGWPRTLSNHVGEGYMAFWFLSTCPGLGQTNLYSGFLEARVQASNKERVYGLVHPNHLPGAIHRRLVLQPNLRWRLNYFRQPAAIAAANGHARLLTRLGTLPESNKMGWDGHKHYLIMQARATWLFGFLAPARGWGEPTCIVVPRRQGFRHPTRNECMGQIAQITYPGGNTQWKIGLLSYKLVVVSFQFLCCILIISNSASTIIVKYIGYVKEHPYQWIVP